jgi:hypothetical protein
MSRSANCKLHDLAFIELHLREIFWETRSIPSMVACFRGLPIDIVNHFHPFLREQLMPGKGGMHSIPDPMFRRRALGSEILARSSKMLTGHHGRQGLLNPC